MTNSNDDNKEYKGPGPFTNSVLRGLGEGFVGGLVGRVIGGEFGANLGIISGWAHGGYRGYKNAVEGKGQVDLLNAELKVTTAQLEEQKSFVAKLTKADEKAEAAPTKTPQR